MFNLEQLIRDNIKKLKPYSSARDEFSGEAKVFLDANENSLGSPLTKWYNRYPDPHQQAVKQRLGTISISVRFSELPVGLLGEQSQMIFVLASTIFSM